MLNLNMAADEISTRNKRGRRRGNFCAPPPEHYLPKTGLRRYGNLPACGLYILYNFCRHSRNDRAGGHIAGDDRAGRHNRAFADSDAG